MSTTSASAVESHNTVSTYIESSPLKKGQRPVAGHVREEIAKRITRQVISDLDLEKIWGILDSYNKRKTFETYPTHLLDGDGKDYVSYLNRLSMVIHDKECKNEQPILFVKTRKDPFPSPSGTRCIPDFVAIRRAVGKSNEPQEIEDLCDYRPHWSHFEATGEIRSSGISQKGSHVQAASYTYFHLQARPDLTDVLGMYVIDKGFRLAISNACGVAYLSQVGWNDESAVPILYAWLFRLYSPFKDPDTDRIVDGSNIYFTIRMQEETYDGCVLAKAYTAFGKRTTLFETPDKDLIKYQYIELDRRYLEPEILDHIHAEGPFPGVVRVKAPVGTRPPLERGPIVTQTEQEGHSTEKTTLNSVIVKIDKLVGKVYETKERQRTRLVMEDRGISLMDVETPRDVLIIMYDLLETTRFLWRERRTLHRDISEGNVMAREELSTVPEDMNDKFQGMHFATYLLGEDGPNPKAHRLQTPLLLIDYELAQKDNPKPGKTPTERTGTSYFMARAVRTLQIRKGDHIFHSMPQLSEGGTRYEECLEERLQEFKPNEYMSKHQKFPTPIQPFQHKLRYDAESVFWLLLWWSMQVKPENDTTNVDTIKKSHWSAFTGGVDSDDPRKFFIGTDFPEGVCHPKYQALEELLDLMADQLRGDHSLLEDRDRDEYLHEAFQRLIFDFLCKHLRRGSEFLKLKTSPDRRRVPVEEDVKPPLATHLRNTSRASASQVTSSSKRGRNDGGDDEHEEESRSGKKVKV
ncbi:hypothetical protein CPB86DRAFT_759228 [Serendipita vermifera]|nr:hypothetical protein CPB86DRAFT_759228 [Serendipita vermifera]